MKLRRIRRPGGPDMEKTNEYCDMILSFGVEFRGENAAGAADAGENDKIFIDYFDTIIKFEVENKVRRNYSSKRFLGGFGFSPRRDDGEKACDTVVRGSVFASDFISGATGESGENSLKSRIKIINVVFLSIPREPVNLLPFLLDNAQHRCLTLETGGEEMCFQDLLKRYGLEIITPPKSVVSVCGKKQIEPGGLEMTGILGHQTCNDDFIQLEYRLDCEKFTKAGGENISNYAELHMVMSNCNITMQHYFGCADKPAIGLPERFRNLALVVFILDITMAKLAKLSLIGRMINGLFQKTVSTDPGELKTNVLDINRQIAELTRMWHENTFVYPITEYMAQKIFRGFEIDETKSELDDLRSTFERYMTMYLGNLETAMEKKRQNILKILTFMSGLTAMLAIVNYIFECRTLWVKLPVFGVCFVFLFIIVYGLSGVFKMKKI